MAHWCYYQFDHNHEESSLRMLIDQTLTVLNTLLIKQSWFKKKISGKVWSFTKPPSDPPHPTPRFGLFSEKKFTPIFFFENCIFTGWNEFYAEKKFQFFLPVKRPYPGGVRGGILSPRIWAVRATFKAVLMAVDMSGTLQTKCKTCFGGPRMILQAYWINTFPKKQYGFLLPPPPHGKRPYFSPFFSAFP